MAFPLPLMPWAGFGADSVNGAFPNALGMVYFYETDGVTPKDVFTGNSTSDPVHTNPLVLDADGRPASPVYFNGAYAIDVRDENDVSLYTIAYMADIGSLYASTGGQVQAEGSKGVSLPYTADDDDNTVTVDDVGGGTGVLTLPDVTTRQLPLFIINESDASGGGKTVRITPQAGQTIQNGIQTTVYFELDPATTLCFWAQLWPDGPNGNWLVFSNMV